MKTCAQAAEEMKSEKIQVNAGWSARCVASRDKNKFVSELSHEIQGRKSGLKPTVGGYAVFFLFFGGGGRGGGLP